MDIKAYIESGVIESYVLGLASPDESNELEILQAKHPEVRQAVLDFSGSLEELAVENAVIPPGYVKAKVMNAITTEKSAASVVPISKHDKTIRTNSATKFQPIRILAAASVMLFILSAALNFYLYKKYQRENEAYTALLTERNGLFAQNEVYQTRLNQLQIVKEMMADTSMLMIKMQGTPGREGHLATIFWDTRNKDVYVMPNKLPHPAKGKQFQLWALVDGKPVDAGVLDSSCAGVCKMKNIPKAEAFAITLENEGGSPTPTMQQMYVLGKV